MSRGDLVKVAAVVAEARRLGVQMRSILDDLDAVLCRAEELNTDEIVRLEESRDA